MPVENMVRVKMPDYLPMTTVFGDTQRAVDAHEQEVDGVISAALPAGFKSSGPRLGWPVDVSGFTWVRVVPDAT